MNTVLYFTTNCKYLLKLIFIFYAYHFRLVNQCRKFNNKRKQFYFHFHQWTGAR
jgi:hypothetical protein